MRICDYRRGDTSGDPAAGSAIGLCAMIPVIFDTRVVALDPEVRTMAQNELVNSQTQCSEGSTVMISSGRGLTIVVAMSSTSSVSESTT